MKIDRFWEIFWLSLLVVALLVIGANSALFFMHINSVNAAAVGVSFDPSKDPFEGGTYRANLTLGSGYAYRNSLPVGATQWSWDTTLSWSSTEQIYEGSAALKMLVIKPWGGMGINGFSLARNTYDTISLAVYPDAAVGDLYIELYDAKGHALTRQSIGWYAPQGSFVPNQWQYLSIPLANLLDAQTNTITGFSISAKNPGVAYLDAIQFGKTGTQHAAWKEPEGSDTPPYNPFATSTPLYLPYKADFSLDDFNHWYSYYGLFEHADGDIHIGPQPGGNTDSMSVIKGGRFWSDYKASATLNWGISSVFSILMRFADPQNYVSCAFSYYGQTVQIYQIKNGASTELSQTPTLPIKYDQPWQDVSVGAAVEGHRVSCYVNGEKVLSANIPDMPPLGTVGLEAWDQNSYSSPHTLTSLRVEQMLGE